MAVSLLDTTKIPLLAVWASRNGYPSPAYYPLQLAVAVAGALDSVIAAELSAIGTTTPLTVLMASTQVEVLPAGLSSTLADAKVQAKACVNSINQKVGAYLVSEDELSDTNLGLRMPIYREVALFAGTASEIAAVEAQRVASGSVVATAQAYAEDMVQDFDAVRVAVFQLLGRVQLAMTNIAAAASVAAIYTEIDNLTDYISVNFSAITPIVQGGI